MRRPGLPTVAAFVFGGFGLLMVAVGIVVAFDDPAGLAASAFGLVFCGVGWLAWKLFRTPPGTKAVVVSSLSTPTAGGSHTSQVIIHVDEDADAAAVAAAREAWLRETWARRADWVEGVVVEHDVEHAALHRAAAVAWAVFAAGAIAAAFAWGGVAILVAIGASGVAGGLAWRVFRDGRRRRRFGITRFRMRPCPAVLGGELGGVVETGVAHDLARDRDFLLTLRCVHRRESTERRGGDDDRRTRYHRDVLWESTTSTRGRAATRGALVLDLPVSFAIPPDRPATSLGGGNDGVAWELGVSLSLPGIDFAAEFRVPVLDGATAHAVSAAAGAA